MKSNDIDVLIARIRAETATLTHDDAEALSYGDEREYLRLPPVILPAPVGAVPGGRRASDQLYGMEDEAFVERAYQLVLKRAADATGLGHCLDALDNGASRLGIAATLRLSREGRARGGWIQGMGVAIPLVLAQRMLRPVHLASVPAALLRRYDRLCARRAETRQALPRLVQSLRHAVQKSFTAWQRPLQVMSSVVLRHDRTVEDLRQRMKSLEQDLAITREDAQYLRQVAVRAERAAAMPQDPAQDRELPLSPIVSSDVIEAYYVAFENANRGTMDEIRAKLSVYDGWLDVMGVAGGKVIDIGCGRGEWLTLLAERGIPAQGIDTNGAMVDLCRKQGLTAHAGDALTWLRGQADASVGAVTAFHVIEHLPFDYLYALIVESRRVLVPGGGLLFETPNPENALVGSHTFYHDFSHRNPITPTAISFLLKYHGFSDIDLVRSSPYPAEARVPGDDPLTERVNGHLCGPQDFGVMARKPLVPVPAGALQ
ncbi:methyltransferase domain-containing protein [Cupriavidus basilensis]|uniref:methyltransferase domain-containing protein n=1 Tax=Cupriavidus basilensis TaxID=68895 RepID=UPI0023E80039|nr:methyltransferase domain-containing protein [Cupriavidus basilensis]MDF3886714.1 methyltransferase domain-containing protein [Cupriavidus basilensis]